MPYTPHTNTEVKEMLETIGLDSERALFDSIPESMRAQSFDVPEGLSEFEVFDHFKKLASKNDVSKLSFMGGGYYDHIIPAAVDALSMRSEFYTAYTPYQAEASQGTLQALYEYQSLICEITDMEATNASMYDGGSAMAEAALMAMRLTRRNKVVIDSGVNPLYIKIVKTYLAYHESEVVILDVKNDLTCNEDVLAQVDDTCAAFIFQNPNFFGTFQDMSELVKALHVKGVLSVAGVYPLSLGLFKSPGEMDVDIVCGDGQSLGNYLGFGGPSFGILACKEKHIRNLPGRIAGGTVDKEGRRAFVLTLQAREQHIRRHKATSNICSNQNLMALRATIFLSLLGKEGFKQLARQNFDKGQYLRNELSHIKGVTIFNEGTTFNECVLTLSKPALNVLCDLEGKGIFGGIALGGEYKGFENRLLVSVTEKHSKADIDLLVQSLKEVL